MFNFFSSKKDTELFYKTDVHCHILPGVDHGATTLDDSLKLLEAQRKMGIENIIATSHVTKGTFENTPETLSAAYNLLCEAIKENNIGINLKYSAEYRVDDYFIDQFKNDKIIPFPNNYLLIENSFQQELLSIDELIFDINLKNLSTIIAHPERYEYYSFKKQRFNQLHDAGNLFQINILSFTGYFGPVAQSSAEWLLSHNMIDLLGSDMHNLEHAQAIAEFIKTKSYRKIKEKLPNLGNDKLFI